MAAPRATQFIALRNLARGSQQVRQLHMTGPATYASPVLSRERSIANFPRDIAALRAECKRRKINATGTESDLLARLDADELAHARPYSTLTRATTATAPRKSAVRAFNTSRSLKAVNDNSTIDFAFFPIYPIEDASAADESLQVRVPIIADIPSSSRSNSTLVARALEVEQEQVMKPEISTMSADAVFLPMSDLTDGHAMNIDFHAMADRVARNLRRMTVPVEERAGMMKQIWNDMVDDLMKSGNMKPSSA